MAEPRTLLIEGWRFIPHSYAVVNQFQSLELLRRPGVRLLHRDVPYVLDHWRPVRDSLDPPAEAMIRSIPAPAAGDRFDAIYRISFPLDFSPSPAPRTCIFGTAEFGHFPAKYITGAPSWPQAMAATNHIIITSSRWSRDGFLRGGADPNRVVVIPLGFEPQIFHPLGEEQRQARRLQSGWDGFVFLSVGAMTVNKGMDLLLKAFAAAASRHPRIRLVLKGLDAFYGSQKLLADQAKNLTSAELALIQPRLQYVGGMLRFSEMALLFQMADAYVAPYSAEGFALPVLEAIACGCPVLCTAGGSTDDFTTSDFALRIDSRLESTAFPDGSIRLETRPNFDSLLQHMLTLIEQPGFSARAHQTGPQFAGKNFTWKAVVDQLLNVLLPD